MTTTTKRLVGYAGLAAACISASAYSETVAVAVGEADTTNQEAEMRARGAIIAQSANQKRSLVLDEVVVSAQRRRDERLMDTPISVGLLSGEMLDQGSSRSVVDVLNRVGGVSLTETQPGQVVISVRGAVPGAGSSTAAYYQDDVPFSTVRNSQLLDSGSFDLARVEVLRGPQGTLYGANSLSGVVRVLTNDANVDSFEFKGRTRASTTDEGRENYGGDVALNVPLIPGTLAVRTVLGYSDLSGFIDSSLDGREDINDTQAQNYRLKISYHPTQNFNARLGYSRGAIDNGAPYSAFDGLVTPFSSYQPNERVSNIYSLAADYELPKITILSSTGYIDDERQNQQTIVLGGAPTKFLGEFSWKSFSQELRVLSQLSGPWQWSAGAFYRELTNTDRQDVRPAFPGVFLAQVTSESWAVFGELTRSFSEGKFEITAGLRYFDDTETLKDISVLIPGVNPLLPDRSAEYDRVTGRLVLTYKPQDRLMVYGSVGTGFRSGLQPTSAVTSIDPSFRPVDPDSLISYELGAKGSLLDGALTYDTALYYTEWEDLQQFLILPVGFTAPVNAGSASGPGVDVSLSYRSPVGFGLHASVGWNDLRMDEDVFSRGVALFAEGSRLNDSPEWTGSAGIDYRLETSRSGTALVASATYAYGSTRQNRFLTGTTLNTTLSEYTRLLNASLGIDLERWSVALYADNVLNEDGAIAPPSPAAAFTSIRARPRTIGLQVSFDY